MKHIIKTIAFSTTMMLMAGILFTACTKADYDDDFKGSSPPPIGPYNISNDVASDASVAKWSFENMLSDSVQNLSPSKDTAIGYTEGRYGFGYALQNNGGYTVYSNPGTIPSLQSYSIAYWMKAPQTNGAARGIFSLNRTDDFWGNLDIYQENLSDPTTVYLKVHMYNNNITAWSGQFTETKIAGAIDKWTHIVITYDGTTSAFRIYANNQLQIVSSAGNDPSTTPTLHGDDPASSPNAPLYGPLKFLNATAIVIGTWQFQTYPPLNNGGPQSWAGNFNGSLDEFRIYNRALTPQEVNALFRLEKLGQ